MANNLDATTKYYDVPDTYGGTGGNDYKAVTIVVTNLKSYQTASGGKDEFKIKANIE